MSKKLIELTTAAAGKAPYLIGTNTAATEADAERRDVKVPLSLLATELERHQTGVRTSFEVGKGTDNQDPDGYRVFSIVSNQDGTRVALANYWYQGDTGQVSELVYSNAYTGNALTTDWQSLGGGAAVRVFSGNRNYLQDDLVRVPDMANRLFAAKADLSKASFPGGVVPTPTGLPSDANWQEVSPSLAEPEIVLGYSSFSANLLAGKLPHPRFVRVTNRDGGDVLVTTTGPGQIAPVAILNPQDTPTQVRYDVAADETSALPSGGPGVTVVQTTGTSTTAVMSQDAVTTRLLTDAQKAQVEAMTSPVYSLSDAGVLGYATLDAAVADAGPAFVDGAFYLRQTYLTLAAPATFAANTLYASGLQLDVGAKLTFDTAKVYDYYAGGHATGVVNGATFYASFIPVLAPEENSITILHNTGVGTITPPPSGTATLRLYGTSEVSNGIPAGIPAGIVVEDYRNVLTAPNGTRYRLTVDNAGTLITTAL